MQHQNSFSSYHHYESIDTRETDEIRREGEGAVSGTEKEGKMGGICRRVLIEKQFRNAKLS